ncbi:MAG: hypothetical protein JRJ62_01575 [Deltaproteobacteria bacterium]|nr:hypothetical protein [Deltaproteobacteria bacterium]
MVVNYESVVAAFRANWNSANAPKPRIDFIMEITGSTWKHPSRETGETLTFMPAIMGNIDNSTWKWYDERYLIQGHFQANSKGSFESGITEAIRITNQAKSYFTGLTEIQLSQIVDKSDHSKRSFSYYAILDFIAIQENNEK